MKRAYNFNAGPSAMPEEVLKEAQAEFLNYKDTGMGIMVPPKLTCVLLYSLYRASPSDSSSAAPERNKYVLLLPRTTRQLSEKHQHTASLSQRFLIIQITKE